MVKLDGSYIIRELTCHVLKKLLSIVAADMNMTTVNYICAAFAIFILDGAGFLIASAQELGIAVTGDGWRFDDSTVQVSTPSIAASHHSQCCAVCQAVAPDTEMYIFNESGRCYCRKQKLGVTPVTFQENGQWSHFCNLNTGPTMEPPSFYLTDSNGGALLKYPELMGVYEQSEEILNHLPVYKQLDGPGNIFAHKFGIWVVSKTLNDSDPRPLMFSDSGDGYNKLGPNSDVMPYKSGWMFYDNDCETGKRSYLCSYNLGQYTRDGRYHSTTYVRDYKLRIVPTQSGNAEQVLQIVLDNFFGPRGELMENWNYYLPDDVDTNHNGVISKEEIELKIKEYIRFIFDHMDQDSNTILSQWEFQMARIDPNVINKIVDIAFKSYPLKTIFGHGDRNKDGFISEDDFILPEKDVTASKDVEDNANDHETNWSMKQSVLQHKNPRDRQRTSPVCADSIGQAEAQVLCRQLGHTGLESLSPISFKDYGIVNDQKASFYGQEEYVFTEEIRCRGDEANLDECQGVSGKQLQKFCPVRKELLASVTCTPSTQIGEITLKGGKDSSSGALYIGDAKYGPFASENMAKVVCRQLGFTQNIPQIWGGQVFFFDQSPEFYRKFECNGSEERLEDCQLVVDYNDHPWTSAGIICNYTLPFYLEDEELNAKYGGIDSEYFSYIWEYYAPYLFIADTNGDSKTSKEEIKDLVKLMVGHVLIRILDNENDGSFSIQDLTELRLRYLDVRDFFTDLFNILAKKGKEELPMNRNILDVIDRYGILKIYIYNNFWYLRDFFSGIDKSKQVTKMLSKTLDTNQDGLLHRSELRNLLSIIKKNIDSNKDDIIEGSEVFIFLRKSHIFSCLQTDEIKTFVEDWIKLIQTQVGKLLDYFFVYLDLDHNGDVTLREIFEMPKCSWWTRDQNDPHRCYDLFEKFYEQVEKPDFPTMEFNGTELDGKMANTFCTAMQPTFNL